VRLNVLSTARAVAQKVSTHLDENQLIEKTVTIADFFEKAVIVENRVSIDSNSRVLLLNESIDYEEIKTFGFEKDFISFIKNSEFIFKFFDEIFAQNITLENIEMSDVYGEYSDHLELLGLIYKKYKQNLVEHNYYDRATMTEYEINHNFFENYSSIDIHLEGFLTNIEFEIVQKVAKVVDTKVHIEYNRFNKKMVSKFQEYGLDYNRVGKYTIDMSNQKIESFKELTNSANFEVASFSNKLLQASFVFKKIYDFVEIKKYNPEKVAVILPDESFATVLEDFDTHKNLNFAMGKDFSNSIFYQKLQAIYLYFVEYNEENIKRVKEQNLEEIVESLKKSISKHNSVSVLFEIFDTLKKECSDKEKEAVDTTVYKIEKFAHKLKTYYLKDLLSFSLRLFNEVKIDDVSGGKIKVIGVLESRDIEFDGVIIVSFNEGVVPKVSTKDIFLNSKIKKYANLPTKKDREELQKYYYSRLFSNSKEVAICYVDSDEYTPSRFLKELNLKETKQEDKRYQHIIFNKPTPIKHYSDVETIANTWASEELSSTRLNTFLSCKRKFYYHYIKKLAAPSDENRDKLTIGLLFHNAFNDVLDCNIRNKDKLKSMINSHILDNLKDNSLKFDIYKWMKYIDGFCQAEIDRFEDGYSIFEKEKSHTIDYEGIKLTGRIDRVDIKDDKLTIIDYKIKENVKVDTIRNYEKTKDFQLEFYFLLIKEKYQKEIEGVALYDVKRAKLVTEEMLYEKLAMLNEKIEEYKAPTIETTMCEEKSNCLFCPYSTICNR
jgi:RecB family exonuclease